MIWQQSFGSLYLPVWVPTATTAPDGWKPADWAASCWKQGEKGWNQHVMKVPSYYCQYIRTTEMTFVQIYIRTSEFGCRVLPAAASRGRCWPSIPPCFWPRWADACWSPTGRRVGRSHRWGSEASRGGRPGPTSRPCDPGEERSEFHLPPAVTWLWRLLHYRVFTAFSMM